MKSVDKYVYPDSDVLINKFNCKDAEKLREIEALSTGGNLAYLQLHPVEGDFDFKHLKEIHHFIFQDLFEWAGQIRTVDIGKNNLFCRAQFIESYAESVFRDFFVSCYNSRIDREKFIITLAKHYGALPRLERRGLRDCQYNAEIELEKSMKDGKKKNLAVLATGSGKTCGDRTRIIDAKYYERDLREQFGKVSIPTGNLYQIFTYVKTKENELAEVPHEKVAGMLLCAQTEEEGKFNNEYQMMGNRICVRTLDLSGDFQSIKKQLDEISEKYLLVKAA